MLQPRIVILSGAPGVGKTTIARLLSEQSACTQAVHIEADEFWQFIRKGYIKPWLDDAVDQNTTTLHAVAASAEIYAQGGYDVFVSGVIGPWHIEPWLAISQKGVDVRYVILRPSESTTAQRAMERIQRDFFPLTEQSVRDVRNSFMNLNIYEPNVIDTTHQTIEESVACIAKGLEQDCYRLADV